MGGLLCIPATTARDVCWFQASLTGWSCCCMEVVSAVCWDKLRLVLWWLNMEAVLSKLTFGAAPQSLCGSV